mmetsp:Transcript_11552/g.48380  ORF Transcript_11552/g.48380 Transcript_11552/m.48380 type:complete len:213 (+) Transcript_11552:286-924(+)
MASLPPRHGTQRRDGSNRLRRPARCRRRRRHCPTRQRARVASHDERHHPRRRPPAGGQRAALPPRALQRRRERHLTLRHRPVLLRVTPPGAVPIAHPVGAPGVARVARRENGDGVFLDSSAEEIHAHRPRAHAVRGGARGDRDGGARGRARDRARREGRPNRSFMFWFWIWLFWRCQTSGEEDPAHVTRAPRADVAAEDGHPRVVVASVAGG